jgi:hypothetical protein
LAGGQAILIDRAIGEIFGVMAESLEQIYEDFKQMF